MPKTEVIELCAKNFDFRVLSSAAEKLNEHKSVQKQNDRVSIPQTGESQVLAIRIFDRISFLIGKSVNFYVSSHELCMIPGVIKTGAAAVSEVAVSARLSTVETTLAGILDVVNELRHRPTQQQLQVPTVTVQPPAGGQQQQQPGGQPGVNSFADAAARAAALPPVERVARGGQAQRAGGQSRDTTPGGTKRIRTEDNNDKKKIRPKVTQGNGKFKSSKLSLVPPSQIYIGNVNADLSAKDVEETLIEAAEDPNIPDDIKLSSKLEILEVKDLTKERPDGSRPWNRNWVVTVPHKHRDYMLRPEALPEGWTSRKYFPARPKRPDTGAGNHFKTPTPEQIAAAAAAQAAGGAAPPPQPAVHLPVGLGAVSKK